jgi:hypothetical protein
VGLEACLPVRFFALRQEVICMLHSVPYMPDCGNDKNGSASDGNLHAVIQPVTCHFTD